MKIGILSDTHSRYQTTSLALEQLRARGVGTVLHCGDIEDPATVVLFEGFEAHFVFGNCDSEREALGLAVADIDATLHGDWGHLERAGVKIAFTHGDDRRLLRDLEHSGAFAYLFYGHTHQAEE